MNKYTLPCILILLSSLAIASPYKGVLDLGTPDPQTVVDRDFTYGLWRAGLAYPVWHLQNTSSNSEVFHLAGFWETGIDGNDKIYGARIGVNLGQCALAALSKFEVLVPALDAIGSNIPPWASKLNQFTSLDLGGAYAPGHAHVSALIGGTVTIPISEVYAWAAGNSTTGRGL